jgi:hypothetical protein
LRQIREVVARSPRAAIIRKDRALTRSSFTPDPGSSRNRPNKDFVTGRVSL